MSPYYDEGGITIYHGDCRDVLPDLAADVVITDPPYNVGMKYADHTDDMPDGDYREWCLSWWRLLPTEKRLVFPGLGNQNWWAGLNPSAIGCWYKPGNPSSGGPFQWSEFEPFYIWGLLFGGSNVIRAPVTKQAAVGEHPCPKPLSLMRSLVGRLRTQGSILDPFMGSGSTLLASRESGRAAIGIEVSERYCEIAVQRLAQGVLQFDGAASRQGDTP